MATLYADYEVANAAGYGDLHGLTSSNDLVVQKITFTQTAIVKSVFAYFVSKSDTNAALHNFVVYRVSDGVKVASRTIWLTEVTGWKEYQLSSPVILNPNVEYAVGFYVPSIYATNIALDASGTPAYVTGQSTPAGVSSTWWGRMAYTASAADDATMPTTEISDTLLIKLGVSLNTLPTAPTSVVATDVVTSPAVVPVTWTHNDPNSDPQTKYQIRYRPVDV